MLFKKYSLNNVKLRNKLLLLYIFCVFLPILLTNIIFYNVTANNIKAQKMDDIELVVDQITNEFNNAVDQAIGISSGFYTNTRIYDFFETEYETAIDYIEAYDFYLREYSRFSPLYYSIQSISFYTDNPSFVYAGGIRPLTEHTKEEKWYRLLTEANHPIIIRTNPATDSGLFSVIRELDYHKNKYNYKKIVRIDLNPLTIKQIFNNAAFTGEVYLLNGERNIEFSSNEEVNWRTEQLHFDALEFPEDTIFTKERMLSQNYLEGWRVAGTISENEILEELYKSREFIVILASINLLFPTLLIVLISKSIHSRLLRVLKHMKRMKKQKFDIINFPGDKDEIGELTNEFNKMSQTINRLINEVYASNIEKKDLQLREKQAQLSALQSQINPHFLFNALETIRMRSMIKGEKETAKIIQNMAKIFRNSLTWGKDWVTVRDELCLIICFLEIQKYRFGDKMEYELDIDEEAYDYIIPNMVFLPFVENASIHGIESVKEKGIIQIRVEKNDGEIVYEISDNGAGMDEEKLASLIETLKNEESMGENVGIKNVYYRLKLHYKNHFDFSINSRPGQGTTVQIKLPAEKK
jgi:two-component system sensor histidine kinase YesM